MKTRPVLAGIAPLPVAMYLSCSSEDAASRTAFVVPETLSVAESAYRIAVSDSVLDAAGNPLASADTTSFETGALDCAHLADYLEPNDDEASAAPIDTATVYRTLSECDDWDFFLIDLAETTRIDFHITFRHAASQWSYLELMRDGFDEPYFTRWWHSTEAGSADNDWFTIDLEAGQTLTVTVTRDGTPAERWPEIWLPDGTGIQTIGTTDNPMVMDWTTNQTGTHRISTHCPTDSEGYQMVVDVSD